MRKQFKKNYLQENKREEKRSYKYESKQEKPKIKEYYSSKISSKKEPSEVILTEKYIAENIFYDNDALKLEDRIHIEGGNKRGLKNFDCRALFITNSPIQKHAQ